VRSAIGDFQQAEVSQSVAPQRVGFVCDFHAAADERLLDQIQQAMMGNRHPRLGRRWSRRLYYGAAFNVTGAAVQNKVSHGFGLHEAGIE
jgi:hypothetical protein